MLGHEKPQVDGRLHQICPNVLTVLTDREYVWMADGNYTPAASGSPLHPLRNASLRENWLGQLGRWGVSAGKSLCFASQPWLGQPAPVVMTEVGTHGGDAA